MASLFDIDPPYLLDELYPAYVADMDALPFVQAAFLRPLAHNFADIQHWIRSNVGQFKLTPASWSKKANIAPSTLNRFLEGAGCANLNAKTIEKLSEVIRILAVEDVRQEWESLRFSHELKSGYEIGEAALIGAIGENSPSISGYLDRESDDDLRYAVITVLVPRPFEYMKIAAKRVGQSRPSRLASIDDRTWLDQHRYALAA